MSPRHQFWGEAFGVFCWLWVFHRARQDLPVVLGLRHPWEHAEDPWAPDIHLNEKALHDDWYTFGKEMALHDDDDDDEDEEEEDEDEEDEDDEE